MLAKVPSVRMTGYGCAADAWQGWFAADGGALKFQKNVELTNAAASPCSG